MEQPRTRALDLGLAAGVAALFSILFTLLLQTRLYGDGPGLVGAAAGGEFGARIHFGYHAGLTRFVQATPWWSTLEAARMLSSLCGGLGLGGVVLLARALGLTRREALLAALLCASAPVLLFYSTTVEIHAMQFLTVVGGALFCVRAPWHRPILATVLAGLGLAVAYQVHEISLLLGPGWLVLATWSARRAGVEISLRRALFLHGPLMFGVVIACAAAIQVARGRPLGETADSGVDVMLAFQGATTLPGFVWRGYVAPLVLLVPLSLIALRPRLFDRELYLALVLLAFLPLAFLLWWRVHERGAFMLTSLPFIAILGARALGQSATSRPALRFVLPLFVAVQFGIALAQRAAYDRGFDPMQRLELVRDATHGRGVLLTNLSLAPPLWIDLPDLRVMDYSPAIHGALRSDMTPEEFARRGVALLVEHLAASPGDFEGGAFVELPPDDLAMVGSRIYFEPYRAAFEAELATRFELVVTSRAGWHLAQLWPRE
jgi:hypothetical protein